MEKHFRDELSQVYSKFRKESEVKSKAIENLEQMRQEIKALELNSNGSVSMMWKEKSKELTKNAMARLMKQQGRDPRKHR